MRIAIGSDHAAFAFKSEVVKWLGETNHDLVDFGAPSRESVDYCDYGFAVAQSVAAGTFDRGLLFCGTGVGIGICANKVRGVRAVTCSEPYSAMLSRAHNDANVLALGARVVGLDLAKMIIDVWIKTPFEGGRHADRLRKIQAFEERNCCAEGYADAESR
jgi:ribose 5-phosphate isomerase B